MERNTKSARLIATCVGWHTPHTRAVGSNPLKEMKFHKDYEIVNNILAKWDPIGVPDTVAKTEYTDYVQRILQKRNNLNDLISELETIVISDIGLDYNPENPIHKEHTIRYATAIFNELENQKLISIDELIEKTEKDNSGTEIKKAAKGLLEAINDWPIDLTTIEEFIDEMKNEFGELISKVKLEKYSNMNETWKMESTSSTVGMLDVFPDKSFDEIIQDISDYYKKIV